jgi:hypothetical protein
MLRKSRSLLTQQARVSCRQSTLKKLILWVKSEGEMLNFWPKILGFFSLSMHVYSAGDSNSNEK